MSRSLAASLILLVALGGSFFLLRGHRERELSVLAAAVARTDGPVEERLRAARALERLSAERQDFRAAEGLQGRGRLIFLLANGFGFREARPREPATVTAGAAVEARVAAQVSARADAEVAAQAELISLAPQFPEVVAAALTGGEEADVRRRAAQVAGTADLVALVPALTTALHDPDDGVKVSAHGAALAILRRRNDGDGISRFLVEALRERRLLSRTVSAADLLKEPCAVPVYIAYMERPEATEIECAAALRAIREAAGPLAADLPEGADAKAVRAWWEAKRSRP